MLSFYIGLSFLSNHPDSGRHPGSGAPRAESRRVLRELDRAAGEQFPTRHEENSGILTEPGGRPYFGDRRADFSVSHSRMMAAAAYFTTGQSAGAFRTGCDVQYVDPKKPREETARGFFALPEQEYIFSGKGERPLRFCHIWTLKECFLKARGLSVFDIQKAPAFVIGGRPEAAPGRPFPMIFYLYELGTPPAYVLAVSLEGGGNAVFPEPCFRWFSEDTLPVKSIAEIYAVESPEKTVRPNI